MIIKNQYKTKVINIPIEQWALIVAHAELTKEKNITKMVIDLTMFAIEQKKKHK
jgi:hypothetical protein